MDYLKNLVNRNLTADAFGGYAATPREWIATAVGAALAVGSSLWGGAKASDAAKKANKMIASEKAENDAWYRRRYNQSYADTAAGQDMLRQAREYADKNWKRAQGASKVAGATDESAAMAKEAGNKVVADTLSGMAARDTQRKDAVDAQHRSIQHQLTQQQIGVEQQRAAQITNAAQNASNALISAGAYYDAAGAAKTGATQNPGLAEKLQHTRDVWNSSTGLEDITGVKYHPSDIIGDVTPEQAKKIIGS